jgi:hypothetical protein
MKKLFKHLRNALYLVLCGVISSWKWFYYLMEFDRKLDKNEQMLACGFLVALIPLIGAIIINLLNAT